MKKLPTKEELIEIHKDHGEAVKNLHKSGGDIVKDMVYGANDGIITTFAVVASVAGAGLSVSVVLIMGIANLLADGLAMAAGNFLGTRSEIEYYKKEKDMERHEVNLIPEIEQEEVVEIYKSKGFDEKDSQKMSEIVAKNKDYWVELMLHDEVGMSEPDESEPVKNALVTYLSFVIAGSIPLLPFVLIDGNVFWVSAIATGITLFSVGVFRTIIDGANWLKSGLEMLLIGGLAGTIGYIVGEVIQKIL